VQLAVHVDVLGGSKSGSSESAGDCQGDQGFFHYFLLKKKESTFTVKSSAELSCTECAAPQRGMDWT
jgi:hypothetical protein